MYTLRVFKDKTEINRTQIYLGKAYTVLEPSEEDKNLGIKLRITGSDIDIPDDGICVYKDENAFIMMSEGTTSSYRSRSIKIKA